jgi:carboxylate-amine ligase
VQSLVQPRPLIEENKWRAARFGLDATLVDLERDEERPAAAAVGALAELAASAAGRLGCAEELDLVEQLLDRGDGAREQRAAHAAPGGSLLGVAQWACKADGRGLLTNTAAGSGKVAPRRLGGALFIACGRR